MDYLSVFFLILCLYLWFFNDRRIAHIFLILIYNGEYDIKDLSIMIVLLIFWLGYNWLDFRGNCMQTKTLINKLALCESHCICHIAFTSNFDSTRFADSFLLSVLRPIDSDLLWFLFFSIIEFLIIEGSMIHFGFLLDLVSVSKLNQDLWLNLFLWGLDLIMLELLMFPGKSTFSNLSGFSFFVWNRNTLSFSDFTGHFAGSILWWISFVWLFLEL